MHDIMPRNRPAYLLREKTRHGLFVWYVRKGDGPRTRIAATYGSPEFWLEYDAALAGRSIKPEGRANPGTLAWLVERYREHSSWLKLSPATKRQRENILRRVLTKAGIEAFTHIDRDSIEDGLETRAATPAAARNFLDTMKGVFAFAVKAKYLKVDPTAEVEAPRRRTDGHKPWTDEEIAAFERRWPVGTRQRLAFDLLLYTGLRRGDAARVGRQHIREGVIVLATEKTGEVVTIPILPPLARSIEACRPKGLSLVESVRGEPMSKEGFGNWFRKAVQAAGLDGVSAHGLRKSAATRAAENGATVAELEAIFGWRGGGMASLYTRKADRVRLAKGAAHKLVRGTEAEQDAPHSTIPAPNHGKRGA